MNLEADQSREEALKITIDQIELVLTSYKDRIDYQLCAKKWHLMALLRWGDVLLRSLSPAYPQWITLSHTEVLAVATKAKDLMEDVATYYEMPPKNHGDIKLGHFISIEFPFSVADLRMFVGHLYTDVAVFMANMHSVSCYERLREVSTFN